MVIVFNFKCEIKALIKQAKPHSSTLSHLGRLYFKRKAENGNFYNKKFSIYLLLEPRSKVFPLRKLSTGKIG